MVYRLGKCEPDGLILIPGVSLEHIQEAGSTELKVLLTVAALLRGGELEEEEILAETEGVFEKEELLCALAFWRGCGVFTTNSKKGKGKRAAKLSATHATEEGKEGEPKPKAVIDADEAPFYSAKDLADAAEAVPDFKSLVSFAESRLEKVMNTSELARLYSFLDYLKMPLGVVMLVIEDCASRDKRSLRYITKMLTSFQDEGIDSYEKAEAWFASREEKSRYEGIVRRLFGLGERKLTGAEDEMITAWRCSFGYGEEMLNAAYERTVASAKNPSIRYMHKILESWHRDGFGTPEEVGKGTAKREMAEKSYDLDDYFEKAVSKGRKDL